MQTGVLLLNTGTPESPSYWDVRKYLSEFLSDERVLDIGPVSRFLLLQFAILPLRSYRSAEAYKKVWTESGSPLRVHSLAFQKKLAETLGEDYRVVLGMRYGKPSIQEAWEQLRDCTSIILFPLFPHYASSSTGSALEEVYRLAKREWNIPTLKSIAPFYKESAFVQALSQDIQSKLAKIKWEHLVFSFHGLPQHHIEKSGCKGTCAQNSCSFVSTPDFCYRAQCFASVKAIVQKIGVEDQNYSVAFQSRLGRRPWIKPYFDHLLPELRQRGIKNLAVVCPSFVADCLETVEEIKIRAQDSWKELGGESLSLISCLNDSEAWVQAAAELVKHS